MTTRREGVKRLDVSIDERLHERLRQEAARGRRTISAAVQIILEEALFAGEEMPRGGHRTREGSARGADPGAGDARTYETDRTSTPTPRTDPVSPASARGRTAGNAPVVAPRRTPPTSAPRADVRSHTSARGAHPPAAVPADDETDDDGVTYEPAEPYA